jgi:hypothetical protein
MAAAADRLAGDVLECVSPELVLVDAALAEEARRRLDVPDDTLASNGRTGVEPRPSHDVAEVAVGVEQETGFEEAALPGDEILVVPAAAFEEARGDLGIEDLIVTPEDDVRTVPSRLLVPSIDDVLQRVPESEDFVTARDFDSDDVIVLPTDGHAQQRSTTRSFPPLPSPPSDADGEDATDVVLRLIRDHLEHKTPLKRRRRRFLHFGS